MMRKSFAAALATLLVITSSVSFVAPQKAFAQSTGSSVVTAGAAGIATCALNQALSGVVSGSLSAAASVPTFDAANLKVNTTVAGSTLESCIFNTILIPIARAIARGILQQITASTINWINGSNGTGQPSYVPNLSVHLQLVGDSVALPLIALAATRFNSPFGSAIATSLQNRYAQQTSVAGFVAANQCTLNQSSPNINSYLAGNWSQGGTGTWFALTGPTPNNPYILQQATQAQIQSNVNQAQTNRRQDLVQSGGFLSWCGPGTTNTTSLNGGLNTAATCFDSSGNPVGAQTPGSIIAGYANKTIVNTGIDELISIQDLDSALSAIVTALAGQVLGGVGGLRGASVPTAVNRALTTQLQTFSAGNTTASGSAVSLAQAALANVAAYTSAWQTILNAANAAAANVTSLANSCTAAATTANTTTPSTPQLVTFASAATAQAAAAQTALSTEINPIIAQAQAGINSVAATQAFALRVQSEAAAATSITTGTSGSAVNLVTDTQTLVAMPPSTNDISTIQQNTQASGAAKANPAGSLTVSGGTLIDQVNLINANATALRSACIPPPTP